MTMVIFWWTGLCFFFFFGNCKETNQQCMWKKCEKNVSKNNITNNVIVLETISISALCYWIHLLIRKYLNRFPKSTNEIISHIFCLATQAFQVPSNLCTICALCKEQVKPHSLPVSVLIMLQRFWPHSFCKKPPSDPSHAYFPLFGCLFAMPLTV